MAPTNSRGLALMRSSIDDCRERGRRNPKEIISSGVLENMLFSQEMSQVFHVGRVLAELGVLASLHGKTAVDAAIEALLQGESEYSRCSRMDRNLTADPHPRAMDLHNELQRGKDPDGIVATLLTAYGRVFQFCGGAHRESFLAQFCDSRCRTVRLAAVVAIARIQKVPLDSEPYDELLSLVRFEHDMGVVGWEQVEILKAMIHLGGPLPKELRYDLKILSVVRKPKTVADRLVRDLSALIDFAETTRGATVLTLPPRWLETISSVSRGAKDASQVDFVEQILIALRVSASRSEEAEPRQALLVSDELKSGLNELVGQRYDKLLAYHAEQIARVVEQRQL